MSRSKIAKLLADALKESGISASELARRAKISKQFISDVKNDKPHPTSKKLPNPSREVLTAIAKGLNRPAADFLEACGYQSSISELAQLRPKARRILEMVQEMNETEIDLAHDLIMEVYKRHQKT